MSDIFISYASQDRPVAQRLASTLADEGWSVWWDRTIMPGKSFARMIEDALDEARCVVVLWSETSRDSDWVQNEARHGHERRVLIPVQIEEVKPPFEFLHIHAAPLTDWDGDTSHLGYRQLIAAISDLVGAPPEREEVSGETPEKEQFERDLSEEAARNRSAVEVVRRRQAELLGDNKGLEPKPADEQETKTSPGGEDEKEPLAVESEGQKASRGTVKKSNTEIPPDLATFRDIDQLWCPEMAMLPKGTFMMGLPDTDKEADDSEKPRHKVTIDYHLAVGRYPVTVAEYARFVQATGREHEGGIWCWITKKRWFGLGEENEWGRDPNKSWRDPGFSQTDRHPVVGVNWEDAKAYAEWLGKETGKPYRLLSEAEWEYACRAGTETRYSCGDTITEKDANFNGNVGKTTEVGSYPANPWGLFDMHGNVREWVEDHWHESYEAAPDDGSAWIDDSEISLRVLRGGSWNYIPGVLRSANRDWLNPDLRSSVVGFRVARTL